MSRRSLEKGTVWGPQPAPGCRTPGFGLEQRLCGLAATPGRRCRCGWPSLRCGDAPLAGVPGARLRGGSPPVSARCPQPPWLHRLSPSAALSPESPSSLTSFCRLSESRPPVLSSLRPLCGPRVSFCVSLRSFSHLSGSLSPLSWVWPWLPWAPVELLGSWGGIPGMGDPEPWAWGRALKCSGTGWRLGWVCWLPTPLEAPCCPWPTPHHPASLGPSGTRADPSWVLVKGAHFLE